MEGSPSHRWRMEIESGGYSRPGYSQLGGRGQIEPDGCPVAAGEWRLRAVTASPWVDIAAKIQDTTPLSMLGHKRRKRRLFFFFFILREEIFALIGGGRLGGWGRPCHRWRMEIESGGRPALGIPSLAR